MALGISIYLRGTILSGGGRRQSGYGRRVDWVAGEELA